MANVRKYPDPTPGQKFGEWTVIRTYLDSMKGTRQSDVVCSCSTVSSVYVVNLYAGSSTKCLECSTKAHRVADIPVGTRVRNWTVVDPYVRVEGIRVAKCLVQCDCGFQKLTEASSFKNYSGSCTHTKVRRTKPPRPPRKTDSKYENDSVEYEAWKKMIYRCKPDKAIKDYGGRGISVCDRWNHPVDGYRNFLADMGRKPSPEHSIERRDVNGHYEPGNCTWDTILVQANNKTNNRKVTAFGKTQSLRAWSEETGIPYATLWNRIVKHSWDSERALTEPATTKFRPKT